MCPSMIATPWQWRGLGPIGVVKPQKKVQETMRSIKYKYLLSDWLTNLPKNSIWQKPFWESNSFSASQEIPCILCNPKVHYRIHNSPPPVPVFSQIKPVQSLIPLSWRSFCIVSSNLHLSSKWPRIHVSSPPHTYYMPHQSQSSQFDHRNIIL